MTVLMIDNYDSFTYNLVQYLCELGARVEVRRNDAVTLEEIEEMAPHHVVVSPGPCTPALAGISNSVIHHFSGRIPILGVCLGHQCISEVFGGRVVRGEAPVHGKTSLIHHDESGIFAGLSNPFTATRYHSLVAERETLPEELEVCAWTDDEVVMGIRHATLPVFGVQFHPESILTDEGHTLLANFLEVGNDS
ncbi:MAG: aminodeoxychorismate/anthranilate synthase component II [Actinobacteria bacterium]|jgi:anthranilate synthase component 2|nr:MAG: aminodeoxychorismate/anthranilate synthase component II [Actinomycetota bacterium]